MADRAMVTGAQTRTKSSAKPAVSTTMGVGIALVLGVGALFLIFRNISQNVIDTVLVEDVIAQKAQFVGRPMKILGQVVTKTISQKKGTLEYRFEIAPKALQAGEAPSRFRDQIPAGATVTVFYGGASGPVADTLWTKDEKTGAGA